MISRLISEISKTKNLFPTYVLCFFNGHLGFFCGHLVFLLGQFGLFCGRNGFIFGHLGFFCRWIFFYVRFFVSILDFFLAIFSKYTYAIYNIQQEISGLHHYFGHPIQSRCPYSNTSVFFV